MPLSIIGAGFGRTGTYSVKLALEALGFGPCHHMADVLASPAQLAMWRAAADGSLPDWETAYDGYKSAVDWPTSYFWRELAEAYPGAKILLTVRSPESWYRSFSQTIEPLILPGNDPQSLGVKVIAARILGGRLRDPEHAMDVFRRHNEEVKAAFGRDRLLVYETGEGWEPLCAFLGVPVPDMPFPATNTTEEFQQRMHKPRAPAN